MGSMATPKTSKSPKSNGSQADGPTIGQAIKRAMSGYRQVDIADAIGVHQSRISALIHDQTEARLDEVIAIEDACERPPGFILAALGRLADTTTVPDAIAMDPELSDEAKVVLMSAFEALRTH